MSQPLADLKRVFSASGLYAAGEVLRRGLAFILLPIYTRYLDPAEYGVLELLNVLSGILFACLLLGMPSAVTKCYHRDCETPRDRETLLTTALLLDLPVLILGGALFYVYAGPIGAWITGSDPRPELVRLVVVTAVLASLMAIVLASFRAQERAVAFVVLSLAQFIPAMLLNVVLVVHYELGVHGVLLGNLISTAFALLLGVWAARHDIRWQLNPRLVKPLLYFGVMLIPAGLFGWIIDLSDRYVLRIYQDLEQIAVYAVGYKIGSILQMAVVWPFQLAWPAVSFSISHRPGHRESYSQIFTWLTAVLVWSCLGLSLVSRPALEMVAGVEYREAYRVVPLVTLAYLWNGVYFCVSPGVHLANKTRYLPVFSGVAAALNLGLNFLLVPRYGYLGAAWATAVTFFFLALATVVLSQRVYPIRYEHGKLTQIAFAGAAVYLIGVALEPDGGLAGVAWHAAWSLAGFPLLLLATGFVRPAELRAAVQAARRLRERRGRGDNNEVNDG